MEPYDTLTNNVKQMSDSPNIEWPLQSVTNLSIGSPGPHNYESFVTYLMYNPANGEWVALDRLDWSWAISVTQDAAGNIREDYEDFAYDKASTPVNDEWPTWSGTAAAVLKKGWVQQ